MRVYHGTSERYADKIIGEGLIPRGFQNGNWAHTVPSNNRAVYFTTAYGLHFAKNCAKGTERLAVFEFDLDMLDPELLAPDEDFLEQVTRQDPKFKKAGKGMKARTMWFRKRSLSDFRHHWSTSLHHMGTATYYGKVPPQALTRVSYVPHAHALAHMSDPSISPANYKLMGIYYKNLMRLTFLEPDKVEEEAYWMMVTDRKIPDLSAIEVVDLKKGK